MFSMVSFLSQIRNKHGSLTSSAVSRLQVELSKDGELPVTPDKILEDSSCRKASFANTLDKKKGIITICKRKGFLTSQTHW